MGLLVLATQLDNQIDLWIEFDVTDGGTCPLRGLPPGRTRSVKLSRVRRCCRERGSPEWPIRVMINNDFSGICIHPLHHLLLMTRIIFKYKQNSDGSNVLSVEGIREKGVDHLLRLKGIGVILGRNRSWNKRPLIEIAPAESTPTDLREFEDLNLVGPRQDNSLRVRQDVGSAGSNGSDAIPPPQQERIRRRRNGVGVAAAESALNSGENSAAVETDHTELGDPNIVVPRQGYSLPLILRQAAASARRKYRGAAASPPREERNRMQRNGVGAAAAGRTTPESALNYGDRKKRLCRLLALKRRDTSAHILFLGLAFMVVALARLFNIELSILRDIGYAAFVHLMIALHV